MNAEEIARLREQMAKYPAAVTFTLPANEFRSLLDALEQAQAEQARPKLSDEAAAQVMWAKLCCIQPVGAWDGGTYVITAPTQAEFVASVAPAISTARAEAEARIAELERERDQLYREVDQWRGKCAVAEDTRNALRARLDVAAEALRGAKVAVETLMGVAEPLSESTIAAINRRLRNIDTALAEIDAGKTKV